MQRYERYLPTAFDESMSILEKMNKLIEAQNSLIDVVNTHVEFTSDQLERAFDIIDENLGKQLKQFRDELEEQKTLYEEIRDKIHSDLLPDSVKQKLEEWLLNGTIEELILDSVFPDWVERLEYLENTIHPANNEITLLLPGDFDNLQDAIDYSKKLTNGIQVEILMQSGFQPSSGFDVVDIDLTHVVLKSEDDVVKVASDFTGNFMYGYNAGMPRLACLIDMDDKGADGYSALFSSHGAIDSQCGILNTGGNGVYVRTSTVTGAYTKFTGSNGRALWVTRGANVSFAKADFSDVKGGTTGIYISRASIADLSDIKINNANVSGYAVYVVRSRANIMNAELMNSSGSGLLATSGATVIASNINATGCSKNAVYVNRSSTVQLGDNSNLGNAGEYGLQVLNGSTVNALGLRVARTGICGLNVQDGSTVNITECNATSSAGDGIVVVGSFANLPDAVVSNAQGYGVRIAEGSNVNVKNLFTQLISGISLEIIDGCTVNAYGSNIDRTSRKDGMNESGTGVRLSTTSSLNFRNGKVKGSELRDIALRYGGTMTASGVETTNGTPSISDTNISAFNTLEARGVMFV